MECSQKKDIIFVNQKASYIQSSSFNYRTLIINFPYRKTLSKTYIGLKKESHDFSYL